MLRRLSWNRLGELACELSRLGNALLAGESLYPIALSNLEPPQGGEVLTLPLHGGTRLRRHRELPLGLLRARRPRTRRATRSLGGRMTRVERREFAFECRDASRSLPCEASNLCDGGLALLNQPTERVGEISGG